MLVFTISACFTYAQNNDSLGKAKNLKKWKIAGISFSISPLKVNQPNDWFSVLNHISKTQRAKDKYANDDSTLKTYPYSYERKNNTSSYLSLKLVFKPRKIDFNKLISYTEFSMGFYLNEQWVGDDKKGYTNLSDTTYTTYYTDASFSTINTGIDLLFTLQTPSFFSTIALYSGIGAYGGVSLEKSVYSSASVKYYKWHYPYSNLNSAEILYPQEKDYYLPKVSLGLYMPLGVKINISSRSNIFFEYVFNRQSLLFENGYNKSQWYKGMSIGYRYKFATKPKKEEVPINTPARTPEPFY